MGGQRPEGAHRARKVQATGLEQSLAGSQEQVPSLTPRPQCPAIPTPATGPGRRALLLPCSPGPGPSCPGPGPGPRWPTRTPAPSWRGRSDEGSGNTFCVALVCRFSCVFHQQQIGLNV